MRSPPRWVALFTRRGVLDGAVAILVAASCLACGEASPPATNPAGDDSTTDDGISRPPLEAPPEPVDEPSPSPPVPEPCEEYEPTDLSELQVRERDGVTRIEREDGPIVLEGHHFTEPTRIFLTEANAGSVIRGNVFSDFSLDGGAVIGFGGAQDVRIEQNVFRNIGGNVVDRDVHAIAGGEGATDVTIRDNLFEDIAADGVQFGNLSGEGIRNILIEHNDFRISPERIGMRGENGIDIKFARGPIDIRANVFSGFRPCPADERAGCTGSGGEAVVVHFENFDVSVQENLFSNSTQGLVVLEKIIRPGERPHRTKIVNNWFCGLENVGVRLTRAIVDAELYANTFVLAGPSFVRFENAPDVATYRDNLFVGDGSFPAALGDGAGENQHVPRLEDARLVDLDRCDLRVETGSPITAGSAIRDPERLGIQRQLCLE